MGNILTRDQIAKIDDLRKESVDVPEWGGSVLVRELNGRERDMLETTMLAGGAGRNVDNVRARVVAMTVVDEAGKQVFTLKDIEMLGQKSARAVGRIYSAAMRLSTMEPKDIEDTAKKSEPAQGEDSPSG